VDAFQILSDRSLHLDEYVCKHHFVCRVGLTVQVTPAGGEVVNAIVFSALKDIPAKRVRGPYITKIEIGA
jgi:hypothetical protein